jgi:cation diffusion facilitator family transporter
MPLENAPLVKKDYTYGSAASNKNEWLNEKSTSSLDAMEDGSVTHLSTLSIASDDNEESRLRHLALKLSLYINVFILIIKVVAYARTLSLSVLAALVDSVLDVVSQIVLNYTEKHSSLQRSSAHYPAGASRLEPIGVLTCAALMGMASFEVLKESIEALAYHSSQELEVQNLLSFWSMLMVVIIKLLLLVLCEKAAHERIHGFGAPHSSKQTVKMADPTLEALAQDHWNDALSNGVAAIALVCALKSPSLWFLDPLGAILISLYIIHSWYSTGKEQIEQLTGKSAPEDFIDELLEIATNFDDRMMVDVCRAYHFGPKFLVELEVVLPKNTLLFESHDLGMELQYSIESREEVERCFVHIDYESRPYDEHVVSKIPEMRDKYRPKLTCHNSV